MEKDQNENITQLIEAILFWKGEPIRILKLCELCKTDIATVLESLERLGVSLHDRGIVLMRQNDEVMLGTHPQASKVIEDLTREELSKELSKATLETLSIVLYMSPVKRSTIDYIRGVNSQFSLRHLEMRGLIEKFTDESDSRVYLYRPTFDALAFLGVTRIEDVPGFADVKSKLEEFNNISTSDSDDVRVEPDETMDDSHHVES